MIKEAYEAGARSVLEKVGETIPYMLGPFIGASSREGGFNPEERANIIKRTTGTLGAAGAGGLAMRYGPEIKGLPKKGRLPLAALSALVGGTAGVMATPDRIGT